MVFSCFYRKKAVTVEDITEFQEGQHNEKKPFTDYMHLFILLHFAFPILRLYRSKRRCGKGKNRFP
jgi:hypothetical protein